MLGGRGPRGFAPSALLFCLGLLGCAPAIGGRASFPIVSRGTLPAGFERVVEVDEKRCHHVALFFWVWGDDANHEALVTDILDKNGGDAIADAELTFFSIPAVVYYQVCARVKGTVVKRRPGVSR